jgi:hypothetical protein
VAVVLMRQNMIRSRPKTTRRAKIFVRARARVKAAQVNRVVYDDWAGQLAFVAGIVNPKLFAEQ